jgi:phosphatidate cytidylyltransferase
VGLSLLGLILGSIYLSPLAFTCVIALAAALATREVLRMMDAGSWAGWMIQIASPLLVFIAFYRGIGAATTSGIAIALGAMILRLFQGVDGFRNATGSILTSVLYGPLLLGFAADLAAQHHGVGKVVTVILLTAASDTGGYFAGIIFGKHPMIPSVSPKKSWEGLAGSVIFSAFIGAVLVVRLVEISVPQAMLLGVVMAFTATTGDLIESALKRDAGLKDSGTLLPGHGGILDRVDAQMVNSLVAWFAFTIVFGV